MTPTGTITQTWLQLLISLWQRTGGGSGGGYAPPDSTYVLEFADGNLPNGQVAKNSLTVDWDFSTPLQARLNVNEAALVITESQVTNLVADLAAKVSTGTEVLAGTGLSGGGPLSANVTLNVAANGVTNSLLAQAPADTLKGNDTGSTADVADLTVTQVTAFLSLFTSTLQGLVPASGGGTTNFLRADATFVNPLAAGISGTVTLAALTLAGTQGSLTFTDGLITAVTDPT